MFVHSKSLQSHPTLCDPMDHNPPGSYVHGNSPGKNTEVGCHALFQGIFLTSYISCIGNRVLYHWNHLTQWT